MKKWFKEFIERYFWDVGEFYLVLFYFIITIVCTTAVLYGCEKMYKGG